jgi:hypothetical protein
MSGPAAFIGHIATDVAVHWATGRSPLGWAVHGYKTLGTGLQRQMRLVDLYERGVRTAQQHDWESEYKGIPGYKMNPIGIWYDPQAAKDMERGICTEATARLYPPEGVTYEAPSPQGLAFQQWAQRKALVAKQFADLERASSSISPDEFRARSGAIKRFASSPYGPTPTVAAVKPTGTSSFSTKDFFPGATHFDHRDAGQCFTTGSRGHRHGFSGHGFSFDESRHGSVGTGMRTDPFRTSHMSGLLEARARLAAFDTRLSGTSLSQGMYEMNRISGIRLDPMLGARIGAAGAFSGGLGAPPDYGSGLEHLQGRLASFNTSLSGASRFR